MNEPQKMQLVKGRTDALIDVVSLALLGGMIYFVLNPDKYDRMTEAITTRLNSVSHKVSVWQTRLAIQSLPETDDS